MGFIQKIHRYRHIHIFHNAIYKDNYKFAIGKVNNVNVLYNKLNINRRVWDINKLIKYVAKVYSITTKAIDKCNAISTRMLFIEIIHHVKNCGLN